VPLQEIDITGDHALERRTGRRCRWSRSTGGRAFRFFVDEHDLRDRLARRAGPLTGAAQSRRLVRR